MAIVQKMKEEVPDEEECDITLPLSSLNNRKKKMETGRKLPQNRKRPLVSSQSHETNKKVVSDDPGPSRSYKKKRAAISDYQLRGESPTMERAEEIQANLAPEFPSMIKFMLPSHVTGGFWLGLPRRFCDSHMPRNDSEFVLEDESGEEYKTKYLAEKVGLSGGWRGFSIAHNLLEGDVVVFQLLKPTKFKVYIVRSNNLDEVDGALGLLNLEAFKTQKDFEDTNEKVQKCLEPLAQGKPQEKGQNDTKMVLNHYENDSDDLGSEVLEEAIRFSDSQIDFKEVTNLENFSVSVNGLIIDSELSKHIRTKYYELCCSQKAFLHDNLFEGLNCKLAAGIISETVNISDAIKICKVTTSQEHFILWDKTLKAFEDLGMNVGFLRARLDKLLGLGSESKRCREANLERVVKSNEEMRNLQDKLLQVREAAKKLDDEIVALSGIAERHELMFQQEVNAPW